MQILVPATSANIGPGFDALGLALELRNTVEITRANFASVSILGEGKDNALLKKNNIFLSIFNEIYVKLTGKKDTFRMIFTNQIPFSRGLGSSSAVITSAIAAAYAAAGFKADKSAILNQALVYENHPDNIAPATLGGFVSSVVENGKVKSLKKPLSADIKAVVVIPDKPMSTSSSRQILPKNYTMKECVNNLSHAAFLTSCFCEKRYDLLKIACQDMIHEERRMKALDALFDVRRTAYDNGALMSSLSGSGSSFLNIAYADDAQNLKRVLEAKFSDFAVHIFSFDNDGFVMTQS